MNKVAVITGACGGIGYDMALTFANNGYKVIAIDITEIKFDNINIEFLYCNLENHNEIVDAFNYIVSHYNGIDVLINNGAISKFNKPISDITIEEFDKIIDINLRAAFICCQQFVKANVNREYGRIINIASTRFHQNEAHWEAYGISKGGLISMTSSLCVSLSDTNITVNAISPGWIQTDNHQNLSTSDHLQHPSRRVGKAQDISRATLFLADENSDFINGQNLIIDGGMTKRMIYNEQPYF